MTILIVCFVAYVVFSIFAFVKFIWALLDDDYELNPQLVGDALIVALCWPLYVCWMILDSLNNDD